METRKQNQLTEEISNFAGKYFAREYASTSLMTITRASMASNLKTITIYVSIMPTSDEQRALKFLKRSRSDFREYLKSEGQLSRIPTVDFEIDLGEKNRQRVDELTRN